MRRWSGRGEGGKWQFNASTGGRVVRQAVGGDAALAAAVDFGAVLLSKSADELREISGGESSEFTPIRVAGGKLPVVLPLCRRAVPGRSGL